MRSAYGWSLGALICLLGVASAQVRVEPRPARPGAAPPAAAPAATTLQGTPDQQIAACLWAANRNEVEIAKLAQEKAKSDSVKEFAAQMIKDHSENADKLARVAGNLVTAGTARGGANAPREVRRPVLDEVEARREGREEAREERREGREAAPPATAERREAREEAREERREGREEGREERREAVATAAAGRQTFNWVTIHREVADHCLQTAKKELGKKEGNEFDKCYIGMQVAAHMKMLDELKVVKNYASSQFQQDLEKSIDTVEHHLSEAQKIMEEIKDKPDRGSDREEK